MKQTFLNIIDTDNVDRALDKDNEEKCKEVPNIIRDGDEDNEKEAWIKQMIHGCKGTILTKRPITPSAEEEKLNRRSRSAKLRVLQKI